MMRRTSLGLLLVMLYSLTTLLEASSLSRLDSSSQICRQKRFPHMPTPDDCAKCDRTRNRYMYFPEPCICITYYQCQYAPLDGGYIVHIRKCPPCQCWDQDASTCVRDPSMNHLDACHDLEEPTRQQVIRYGRLCMAWGTRYRQIFAVDLTDPTWYYHLVSGFPVHMPCPPGTKFSQVQCGCVHGGPSYRPKPFMCMTFDDDADPFNTNSGVYVDPVNVAIVPNGVINNTAYFNGSANIEIPAFTSKESPRLSISLFYKRQADGSQGPQALLSNDDCADRTGEATIQLITQSRDTLQAGFKTKQNNIINAFQNVPAVAGAWHHVVMTYNGHEMALYVNGTLYQTRVPATGHIKGAKCPLRVGSMYDRGFFKGWIDQFCVYEYELNQSEVIDLNRDPTYPKNTGK